MLVDNYTKEGWIAYNKDAKLGLAAQFGFFSYDKIFTVNNNAFNIAKTKENAERCLADLIRHIEMMHLPKETLGRQDYSKELKVLKGMSVYKVTKTVVIDTIEE